MASWFLLTAGQDPTYETSYTIQTTAPSCPGSSKICAVMADPDVNNKPVLTEQLKDEMITALQFGTESTHVLLRTTA